MNFMASPLGKFGQNLVHVGILLRTAVNNLLDNLVPLCFRLQNLTRVCFLRLELISGNLIVALGQCSHLGSLVKHLRLFDLLVEHFNLAHAQVLSNLLVLILLTVDIVAHVVDFSLSLLNSRIELHGILGGVPQCLLKVRNLPRQFTLGCYKKN